MRFASFRDPKTVLLVFKGKLPRFSFTNLTY